MARALLWLAVGLVLFLVAVAVLAPGGIALRALGLSVVAIAPAVIIVLVARDSRRRSDVYGGHTPRDPGEDDPPEE